MTHDDYIARLLEKAVELVATVSEFLAGEA